MSDLPSTAGPTAPAGDSNYADAVVQTVREPLLVLDAGLRVKTANRSFYNIFKVAPEQTIGRLV